MEKHDIPKISLDERINAAGVKKNPEEDIIRDYVKKGFGVIGIHEYLKCIMRIMEDSGLEELAREKPFDISYERNETVNKYFTNCFIMKNPETWAKQVYGLFILPFARLADNNPWLRADALEEYTDDGLPFD